LPPSATGSAPPPADAGQPFALARDGVRVHVRLTPRARSVRIDGLRRDASGRVRLAVAVVEVPEAGRANAALLALLAGEWRLPKSSLQVVLGATDREKTIAIAGDGPALLQRLRDWSATRGWQPEA